MKVEVCDLTVRFGAVTALAGVRLEVPEGQVAGIIGANGAGKTTLLRALGGVGRVDAGEVRIGGLGGVGHLRAHGAYCPDSGGRYAVPVGRLGGLLADAWPGFAAERFARCVEELSLPIERRACDLSRGQAARLRLAVALCRPGDVLLLDEPLGGTDLPSRDRIVEVLAIHLIQTGRTALIATHEIRDVEALLERVIALDRGRVAWDEEADALRERTGQSIEGWVRGAGV